MNIIPRGTAAKLMIITLMHFNHEALGQTLQGKDAYSGGTANHNVFVPTTQFDDIFVDFDNLNLHPAESSPTIDAGSSVDAPSIDTDGISRPYGSAYEYIGAIVGVTSINLSPTTLTHGGAETYQFNAMVLPANASNQVITWTSSNPTVASVDNTCIVTTLISGNIIVTATTNDSGFSASCTLPVGSVTDCNLALNQPVTVTKEDLAWKPGTNLVDRDISDVARWSADGFPQSVEIVKQGFRIWPIL